MDNNKDSSNNLAFWIPGSAVILSLVISTFALTREPFLEPRPIGAQFQAQMPIDARLWQDPFDALERYRKKLKESGNEEDIKKLCTSTLATLPNEIGAPDIMVALVEGGPYADEVEQRRRIRYALLAGFKNSQRVPAQEQYIHCLRLAKDFTADKSVEHDYQDIPYEIFVSNPLDPTSPDEGKAIAVNQTIVFWLKQDSLNSQPLQNLEKLRTSLQCKTDRRYQESGYCRSTSEYDGVLKVIGPATSTILRDMYLEQAKNKATDKVEIYSPLATADNEILKRSIDSAEDGNKVSEGQKPSYNNQMKLLRTVSDDGTMTQLLLEELKLRRIDPAMGLRCNKGRVQRVGALCPETQWRSNDRIALISEWDSFYSRALIESFKDQVANDAKLRDKDEKPLVNQWVLRFSYLRGLDGRLPEEAASSDKSANTDSSKNNKDANKIDLSPLEKADGNSQFDYLRRLADHIADVDATYRRNGESGIGAIGILGVDAYDKLLALQALKARMPYKLYFSTDLEARMLQRGQAETTRNLVLAAPYGLTLTRALQQDIPPFRDSLQTSVFVAVLAALAPQTFDAKRAKFDYSKSEMLSPGIYEIGISGFIPLASALTANRPENCEAPTLLSRADQGQRPHDLMSLRCLQDRSPPPYPETSQAIREEFKNAQAFFWAGPLAITLLMLAAFMVWWWVQAPQTDEHNRYRWVRGVPMSLYIVAALSAFIAVRFWHAEFLWFSFALILLGVISSNMIHHSENLPANNPSGEQIDHLADASAWYIVIPLALFVLMLMLAYQMRGALTGDGLGEPMLLFEGISAWPTVALRVSAVLISIAALAWGWRNLRINTADIESTFHLRLLMRRFPVSLSGQILAFIRRGRKKKWAFGKWCKKLGRGLVYIFFPLLRANEQWSKACAGAAIGEDGRKKIIVVDFWREHCVCGSFGARMLRTLLVTWIFFVISSALYVVWPMEGIPVRGFSPVWMLTWLVPTVTFQVLVFWVVDANLLLIRFIRHLSDNHAIWPNKLQLEQRAIFGTANHPCVDEWIDLQLIAKRTSAVSRLIYAPTLVMLILLASRSSLFDNWPTPPSLIITYLLTALILLGSALSLRRAAEKARTVALQRLDTYLLTTTPSAPYYEKFHMIRERISTLNTGSFSRYSEEPLVRALLLSLTGIGGSALVDALNYAKF